MRNVLLSVVVAALAGCFVDDSTLAEDPDDIGAQASEPMNRCSGACISSRGVGKIEYSTETGQLYCKTSGVWMPCDGDAYCVVSYCEAPP
jgi:hypothetical protein